MNKPGRGISLLFDLFVVNQHVRRLLGAALSGSPLRADEYAVYSLLFEQGPLTATEMAQRLGMPLTTVLDYLRSIEDRGHLQRERHPRDGRAQHLLLTAAGSAEQKRTNVAWERMRVKLAASMTMSEAEIRAALHAIDDAAVKALAEFESAFPTDA